MAEIEEIEEIALIVTDLDGTLLGKNGTLSPKTRGILKRAIQHGIRVVFATMRVPGRVIPFCRALDLHDPIICLNGALVSGSPDGPIWANACFPQAVALEIAQTADDHGWELGITIGDMTYWRLRPGQTPGPFNATMTLVATNAEAVTGNPARILLHEPAAIAHIRDLCQTRFADWCRVEDHQNIDGSVQSLSIYAPQADKGAALALVLDRLAIHPEQVMACGDNLSDLALFDHARVTVAVGNALDCVKERASVIAPNNTEHGVGWAINRFALHETS